MDSIDYLIDLDIDFPMVKPTSIMLNRANQNSVRFIFKVRRNTMELDYLQYTKAETVFLKPDKTNVVGSTSIDSTGITYPLSQELFEKPGMITGYLTLFQDDTIIATLYFKFVVVSDLINGDDIKGSYIARLEDIINELSGLTTGIQEDLDQMLSEAQNDKAEFLDTLNDMVSQARDILDNLTDDLNLFLPDITEAGTFFGPATIDSKGRITEITPIQAGDLPVIPWNKISNVPNTIETLGISNAWISQRNVPNQLTILEWANSRYTSTSALVSAGQTLMEASDCPPELSDYEKQLVVFCDADGLRRTVFAFSYSTDQSLLKKIYKRYIFDSEWIGDWVVIGDPVVSWNNITDLPTTIQGFGITNGLHTENGLVNGGIGVTSATNNIAYGGQAGPVEFQTANGGAVAITFHRPGAFACNFGLDTDNLLKIGGYSMGEVAYVICHSGNLASLLSALPVI